MSSLFYTILLQPLWNALILLYETAAFYDLGVAIILLTLVVRLLLVPLVAKGMRQQALMARLKPHIDELGRKHKGDKERHARELMQLYREHGVSPFGGLFATLIQLPVLFALYRIFLSGFNGAAIALYWFVPDPGTISTVSLGLLNVQKSSIVLVIIAALLQYFQGRQMTKLGSASGAGGGAQRIMVWIGPALTLIILSSLPSAVALYWAASTAFGMIQQMFINRALARLPTGDLPKGDKTQHGTNQTDNAKAV